MSLTVGGTRFAGTRTDIGWPMPMAPPYLGRPMGIRVPSCLGRPRVRHTMGGLYASADRWGWAGALIGLRVINHGPALLRAFNVVLTVVLAVDTMCTSGISYPRRRTVEDKASECES